MRTYMIEGSLCMYPSFLLHPLAQCRNDRHEVLALLAYQGLFFGPDVNPKRKDV